MRRAAAVLLVFLFAAVALGETTIRSYDVDVSVDERGEAAGTAAIVIAESPASINIPLGFAAKNVRLTGAPAGTTFHVRAFNNQSQLHLQLPSAAADVPLAIAFEFERAFSQPEAVAGQKRSLPAGNEILRHALVNTEAATIESYRFVATMPRGLRVQSIKEALPKAGRKEAEPRAQLVEVDGAPGVRLRATKLRQGDATSLQVIVRPAKRSLGWLVAGVALSILYLIKFRDLVASPESTAGAVRKPGE